MPRYKNPRKTWFYSNEFKIRAVKLSFHPNNKVIDVAESLGIHSMMLSRWGREYRLLAIYCQRFSATSSVLLNLNYRFTIVFKTQWEHVIRDVISRRHVLERSG